ncbi:MAG: hypothetical protein ABIP92_14750 [Arthrobacter sp.]|uniref:hypothetical protein n=1 Tax=unclassified Arthrobacter TaxID=235627 RepID=UPI001CFFE439|nr:MULTISPECIES: hypothetical protein [unclassified Arthrobacter]MCB5282909.1 hypothetical protein [Arthrobacter sp. ES1]WGZ78918.1 hypothetical protein QI450_13775 [Arthrobacter sp. EM1]
MFLHIPGLRRSLTRVRPARSLRRGALSAAAGAAVVLAATACSAAGSVESTDVTAWKATALPAAGGIVLDDAGKILKRDPIVKSATGIGAGNYVLTISCDGGGKAFFEVSLDGARLTEAGAACNGSRETSRIKVPAAGTVQISTSSVDAPLLYAYQLTPAP